ncbi:MAG: rod-binding protein [Candidatus Lernaella stagnicola]|nr:rod-binding protein [Candidatus Lernaella stagnicola]
MNEMTILNADAIAPLVETGQPAALAARLDHVAQDPSSAGKAQKLWKVAEGFEEMFLHMMFRAMRKTTMKQGLFGDNNATRVYESMQDEYLSREMSHTRQFGLSTMIYDWMVNTRPELRDLKSTTAQASGAYQNAAAVNAARTQADFAD